MTGVARIRESFPYLEECVYLNTASVGLSWRGAGDAAAEFYQSTSRGTASRNTWLEKAEATRRDLGDIIHVPANSIEFLGSTTEALNIIALSMKLGPGDQIVLAADEFPSVVHAWTSRLKDRIEVVRVPIEREEDRTRALCAAITDRTRAIAVSHVHWRTGTRVDLELLKQACRSHDCRLIVDGVQAVGAVPVDSNGVDAYCASVFKWLLSGFGLGFVALSPRFAAELNPAVRGYANEAPSRALHYGHNNYPGIFALQATLQHLKEVGWKTIHERVDTLARRLLTGLRDEGFNVLTPQSSHGGIVSIRDPRATSIVGMLARHGIVVEDANPIVRVSAHFYNDERDIDSLVGALTTGRSAVRA
jgi:cysteine desulfurase / selenocysteine lyase